MIVLLARQCGISVSGFKCFESSEPGGRLWLIGFGAFEQLPDYTRRR